jgi:mono/diheme cytochrome c family protein
MTGRILAWRGIVFAVCALGARAQSNTAAPPSTKSSGQALFTNRALLDKYCVTCHNQKSATAGLMLDKMNLEKAGEDSALWEKVVHKLRTRSMPPAGMPRPDAAGYNSLITSLEDELDRSAAAKPNPGRPSIHRLNRAEYTNAIRDLLAIDIDAESLLPIDEVESPRACA